MILAHDRTGSPDRPAVLLLHAGVCDRRMWDPQWERLGQDWLAVRSDLRGFGDSPMPPEAYSSVDDVLALMDHLGMEAATLVGASMGGRIALGVAAARPERVSRLVLLCPAVPGMRRTTAMDRFGNEEDALLEAGDIDGAVELNVVTWLGPAAPEDARRSVATMQRRAFDVQLAADDQEIDEPEIDLATMTVPTLVVSGGHDMDAFQSAAAELASTMPHARHLHLDWSGHLPTLERPNEGTRLLVELLEH